MRLPDFLLLGAAKAGTSALYGQLGQHPEIFVSALKEPHFFAFESCPPRFRGPPGRDVPMNRIAVTDIEDYAELFRDAAPRQRAGEGSTQYLYLPDTAAAIARHLPDVRLIAVLRSPAERAYSAFMHLRRDGLEPKRDFLTALQLEEERIARRWAPLYHYRHGGYYARQLSRYLELFERERLHIVLYEDYQADPVGVLQGVFAFLGVDASYAPDTHERRNVTGVYRNPLARAWQLARRYPAVRRLVRGALSERTRATMLSLVRGRTSAQLQRPPMPPDARSYLAAAYHSEVESLETLLGRDLSRWYA